MERRFFLFHCAVCLDFTHLNTLIPFKKNKFQHLHLTVDIS